MNWIGPVTAVVMSAALLASGIARADVGMEQACAGRISEAKNLRMSEVRPSGSEQRGPITVLTMRYATGAARCFVDRDYVVHDVQYADDAVAPGTPASPSDTPEPVRFAAGAISATRKGAVHGYDVKTYGVSAGAGQAASILFSPSDKGCAFRLYRPGEDEPAFDGEMAGLNEYSGNLDRTGEYQVRIGFGRADARRGKTCRYSITFEISGDAKGAAPSDAAAPRPSADARVAGTKYHATGPLDCRFDGHPGVKECQFGVVRTSSGARVDVTFPDKFKRVLTFANGKVTASDGGAVTTTRKGDRTVVRVNETETIEVPDIVVEGD